MNMTAMAAMAPSQSNPIDDNASRASADESIAVSDSESNSEAADTLPHLATAAPLRAKDSKRKSIVSSSKGSSSSYTRNRSASANVSTSTSNTAATSWDEEPV